MMKETLLKGIVPMSALCLAVACSDGEGLGFDDGKGSIALSTEVDASVHSGRQSRTEYTDVTPADLSLKLTPADGSAPMTWESVTDFPTDRKFSVGTYTLEAFYGDENTEGFESPAFYGKSQVIVRENQTTQVSLTASVANALVSVDYTDGFKDYMTSWSAEVHSAAGAYIHFEDTESRPAYVKAGQVEINVEFMKPNGKGAKMTAATFEAVAARHYHVTVDLENGAGSTNLVITFDDTLEEAEPIKVDISDEVLNAPAPEVKPVGFTAGTPVAFIPGQEFTEGFKFNVVARGGMQQVKLTTQSASLLSSGWPAEVDLMAADAATQAKLTELGLVTRGIVRDANRLGVVDVTGVLKHIVYLNGGDNTSTFTIEVKDKFGKLSEAVSFVAEAQPLKMNILDTELYVGSTTLSFTLEFNAGDPADLVTFAYRNTRGTDTRFVPASVELLGDFRYKVTGSVDQANANTDLIFTASADGLAKIETTVKRTPQVVPASAPVNAFASRAFFPVTIGEQDSDAALVGQLLGQATVMVSTDGVNFTEKATVADAANRVLSVSGLTPGTKYSFKIKNGSKDPADAVVKTFTTETAAPLTNGSLDEWTSTAHKSNMVEHFVGGGIWSTYNPVTISQWESSSNMSYNATSGTKSTDDAVSGKAALIRTVGWGSGNTASANAFNQWSFGTCKHVSAGQLFLGNWDGVTAQAGAMPNYGTPFTSRPASVKFQYKYSQTNRKGEDNGDFGTATVEVVDAQGNVIASATANLTPASAYTAKELPLSYNHASARAASLRITFTSSGNPSALAANETYMKPPKPLNLSDGEYVGSQLYVDEIALTY